MTFPKFSNNTYILIFLILLFAVSIFTTKSLYDNYHYLQNQKKKEHLEQSLQKASIEFKDGIDKYAILVSGLRSHIISIGAMPSAEEVQHFIVNQLQFTDYAHSIIINYIDTNHTFIFSISESDLAPNNLTGVKLSNIRDLPTIERMNMLLNSEALVSFPPLNIIEGFVGFPIDFRVVIDNKVVGYIAPLLDIKNIIDPIMSMDLQDEFTYRFSYANDILFDRERVYNNTKVHHNRMDSTNMHLPKEQYLISEIESFNLKFNIGITYRNEDNTSLLIPFVKTSFIVILSLIGISILLIYFFIQSLSSQKELKKSNKELSQLNSILKKFVSAASHDLKQPIVNVKNFQSLFKRKFGKEIDPTGHQYLDIISDNINFMDTMLDDFLIYSNVLKKEKVNEVIDLNKCLDELLKMRSFNPAKIFYNNLPTVQGNSSQIQRLFYNLISNAIKYNKNNPPIIKISSTLSEKNVEIRVSDNGIGIKKDHLHLIFNEFQRLNKNEYPGTGLGLTICKEIVDNHGGQIRAENNSIGGTDFIFQLQRHDK